MRLQCNNNNSDIRFLKNKNSDFTQQARRVISLVYFENQDWIEISHPYNVIEILQ